MPIINTVTGGGGSKGGKVIDGDFIPSSFPVIYTPPDGFVGWSNLTVRSPDGLEGGNIRKGVSIAGVEGVYDPQPNLQDKTLTPTEFPSSVTHDEGYGGLGTVTVEAPVNLSPENIREGVDVAGVVGTYDPQPILQNVTVTPPSFPLSVTPSEGYDGLSDVTVNAPAGLRPENIPEGVTIAGVEGTYVGPPTDRIDIFSMTNLGGTYPVFCTLEGTQVFDGSGNFTGFNGIPVTVTQDVKPPTGAYSMPTSRVGIMYGENQYICITDDVQSLTSSTYVGNYWFYHHVKEYPEGDYIVDTRYITPTTLYTRSGYCRIRDAKGVFTFQSSSTEKVNSLATQAVLNNTTVVELGDITFDFDKGYSSIHLPAISVDCWTSSYGSSYTYLLFNLNIFGTREVYYT